MQDLYQGNIGQDILFAYSMMRSNAASAGSEAGEKSLFQASVARNLHFNKRPTIDLTN